jgi:hypothetical protein
VEQVNQHWPVADLDPVRRLRVMAAAIPGADLTEWTIDAPPELVWQVASNLQVEMPRLVRDFRSVTITPGPGGRLVMHARGYLGQRARFDMVLRPGWCWMQSRFLLCGMAAAPDPSGTRFGFLGGIRAPGATLLHPLLHLIGPAAVRLDRLQTDVHRRLDQQ